MTEAQLLAEVTALCGRLGLLWHHDPDSRRSKGNKGFPDLIVAGRLGVIFAELKSAGQSTSADQDRWLWTLYEAKQKWAVWYPVDLTSGRIRAELETLK